MTPCARTSCILALAIGVLSGGCGALTVPDAPRRSNPLVPIWNTADMRQHLRFLNDPSTRGRVDGTVGYGVAAAYVADRMNAYGLQPATSGDFRLLYTTPRNLVRASRVRLGDRDTLSLTPALDFQPDGRSGNAFVAISGLGVTATDEDVWSGPAIPVLRHGAQSDSALIRLRDLGVPMVVVERESLVPRPAPNVIAGLGVLNVTGRAADRILAGATTTSVLEQTVLRLRLPVRVEIIADADPTASGINVVGFVPGKDPVLSQEAVILCTHLDAVGSFGGSEFIDYKNYGVEVAAVLDVARQYASFSRLMRIPERTLIVAFVAGGTIDSGGFRALFRQPVWDMDRVQSVVYVGSPEGDLQQQVQAADWSGGFRIVAANDTIPDLVVPRLSKPVSMSRPGERSQDLANPRLFLNEAVRSAAELAGRLHAIVGVDLMSESASSSAVADGG